MVFVFLSDLLHFLIISRSMHVAAKGFISFSFLAAYYSIVYIYTSSLSIYLLIDLDRLLPCPRYCKQCCDEYWGACIFLNYGFLWIYVQEWDCEIIW